jgi:putative peptidoglycan lipid II flippase
MIAAALWLSPLMPEPIIALAWGVFAAGAVQLLFQFPSLIRLGLLPRLRFGFKDPGVRRIMKLMLPAIFAVSITQINLLLDTMIASFLESGSVSWLYYSDRLVEFPLGVFGIALATVILPSLSKNHAAEDSETFSRSLDWGLRLVVLIGMPASIGLLMLAEPMISTLFQYDQFSHTDVVMAGKSLKAYSIGLLGFILVKVLVPGFTSRKEMKTPVRFGIYAMCANMLMNIAFVFPLAHAGLALATSIGAFINASLLLRKLLQDKVYIPSSGWRIFILRVVLANSAMAAIIFHFMKSSWWTNWAIIERALHLSMWIAIAAVLYFTVLVISGFRLRHIYGKK